MLFNIVPQAAIEAFESQHQLPMTGHWGPIQRPISMKRTKARDRMARKMVVDKKRE